jgi:hypothetical protein
MFYEYSLVCRPIAVGLATIILPSRFVIMKPFRATTSERKFLK